MAANVSQALLTMGSAIHVGGVSYLVANVTQTLHQPTGSESQIASVIMLLRHPESPSILPHSNQVMDDKYRQ